MTGPATTDATPLTAGGAAAGIVLTAELELDRSQFGMTWSPLHIASMTAHGTVTARFTRS